MPAQYPSTHLPRYQTPLANYKVYNNANAATTVAGSAFVAFNSVRFYQNARAYTNAEAFVTDRIITPDAGPIWVMASCLASTSGLRLSLIHYNAAGVAKRTWQQLLVPNAGARAIASIPRVWVAAGDRFALQSGTVSADAWYGEDMTEIELSYLPL